MNDPRLLEIQRDLTNALRVVSELLNEQPQQPTPVPPVVTPPLPAVDNQAAAYGVTVGQAYFDKWIVKNVRHLSPEENRGRHGVYVNVWDEQGNRVRDPNLRIGYTWEGRRPEETVNYPPLDKPDGELGHGVVDLYMGAKVSVWVNDPGNNSAGVVGLHSNHPDERGPNGELWNSVGHHSFQINFVRR